MALLHECGEKLFAALGYELRPETFAFEAGELPVLACYRGSDGFPLLVIALAVMAPDEAEDEWSVLGGAPLAPPQEEGNGASLLEEMDWETAASKIVFGDTHPPRWLLLLGHEELLVIERGKWGRKALLRFVLPDIFGPRDEKLFRAAAALACKDSILPVEGIALLDTLDGNSHKHAYGVSGELKYALREAIELIGNEAIRYKREVSKEKLYDRTDIELASELSRECLTFMYRMLFLLYLEARPELGYAPVNAQGVSQGLQPRAAAGSREPVAHDAGGARRVLHPRVDQEAVPADLGRIPVQGCRARRARARERTQQRVPARAAARTSVRSRRSSRS